MRYRIYSMTLAIALVLMGCQPTSTVPTSYADVEAMVEDAKTRIVETSLEDFAALLESEEYYVLLDVRSKGEHDRGYIPGSVLIPRGSLEFRIGSEEFWDNEGLYLPEKSDKLVLYCKSGKRSALAVDALQKLGYENVTALTGGFLAWKAENPDEVEVNLPPVMSPGAAPIALEEEAGGC